MEARTWSPISPSTLPLGLAPVSPVPQFLHGGTVPGRAGPILVEGPGLERSAAIPKASSPLRALDTPSSPHTAVHKPKRKDHSSAHSRAEMPAVVRAAALAMPTAATRAPGGHSHQGGVGVLGPSGGVKHRVVPQASG